MHKLRRERRAEDARDGNPQRRGQCKAVQSKSVVRRANLCLRSCVKLALVVYQCFLGYAIPFLGYRLLQRRIHVTQGSLRCGTPNSVWILKKPKRVTPIPIRATAIARSLQSCLLPNDTQTMFAFLHPTQSCPLHARLRPQLRATAVHCLHLRMPPRISPQRIFPLLFHRRK